MTLSEIIRELEETPGFAANVVKWLEEPARAAIYGEYDPRLDPRLVTALQAHGFERPYSHQAEAVSAALSRENVVVVTPTASGKTLCYTIPVLNDILANPSSRALYLFPTKALSQDQLDEVHGLITTTEADIKTFTYDGDTPQNARMAVRSAGHIVITNPDMLHTGILPHHTKWVKLFENLRFVVIDELHGYRGVFGSHIANVIRRLKRICAWYGSDPVFICCSATIANPEELARDLLEAPVKLIDQNGAPRGRRTIAVYNPPVVNKELGLRRNSMTEVRRIASRLVSGGVQTIVFTPSRVGVELLLTHLRKEIRHKPGQPERVYGYRGGYLPKERRAIEKGLRDGEIRCVVSTNALELGVDIGSLQAAVVHGYPGTIASLRQQTGRAGRRDGAAFAVMVCNSSPLNQFVANHPEYILEGAPENGLIDPDNPYVLASHIKCAAFELNFVEGEVFGEGGSILLEELVENYTLHKVGGKYFWTDTTYPAEGVSLRSASVDNFVIIEQQDGVETRVIGEIDRPSAPMLVHPEAIYFHGGQQYHVDRLDWEEKKAYVHKVDVDYYTDAELDVDLKVLYEAETRPASGGVAAHGEVAVTYMPTIFKKLKLDTRENVGWGKILLPEDSMHTMAWWLALDKPTGAGSEASSAQGGLWALGNLIVNVAPFFLMCDPRDIRVMTQQKSPHTGRPTVYLYDAIPGGVGLSKRVFEKQEQILAAARELAAMCSCSAGCPSCAGPENEVDGQPKQAALAILDSLLSPGSSPALLGAAPRPAAP